MFVCVFVCVHFCVQEGESEDKAIKEGKVTLEEGLEGMMLGFREYITSLYCSVKMLYIQCLKQTGSDGV